MDFDLGEEKAQEVLSDIGYYRLGFYWNPFEIDNNHNFKAGTKFSDVLSLYYLDVDLRQIINRYLKRIELNFKTKVTYYVSNKYKDSPTWFIDPEVLEQEYIADFDNYYTAKFKNDNLALKKHHKKYLNDKYAPAWKTIEFLSFGSVVKIYKSLKAEDIQDRISSLYGIRNKFKLINQLNSIVYVRNRCAHNAVTFDIRLPKPLNSIPEIEYSNNKRSNLDAVIKVISFILNNISINRESDFNTSVEKLFKSFKGNQRIREIIETQIGYEYQLLTNVYNVGFFLTLLKVHN